MKILFVRSGNNGVDPISQNQGDSLVANGCEIQFFDIKGKGAWGYAGNILKLRRAIKAFNPDIIHAHYSFSGVIAGLCFSKRPIVCSLMGSDVVGTSSFHRRLIKFFVKKFWSATIVKTLQMKKMLEVDNAFVVPNGVNTSVFVNCNSFEAKKILRWNTAERHVLFGADPLRAEKNYRLAEVAVNMLQQEMPIQLHFLIDIPREKVFLYLNAADVMLLTSFHEGSPNVVKEAMACNCPIVSTNVGDVVDIIGSADYCYVTGFDAKEVCSALKDVLSLPRRTNGRECIARLHSDVVAQEIIRIYQLVKE